MSKVTGVVQLVSALEAERDALAAQVELLRKLWNAAQPDIIRLFEIQPIFGDNEREIDGQSCHELQKAFAATPQQCLLDVHIERDAMIAQNKELSRLLVAAEKHDSLKAERDALLAQLNLAKNIFDVLFSLSDAKTYEETTYEVDTWLQLKAVFDATPQQCLLEVQADAIQSIADDELITHVTKFCDSYNAMLVYDYVQVRATTVRQGGE